MLNVLFDDVAEIPTRIELNIPHVQLAVEREHHIITM
jgi:hypothetical protein